MKLTILGSGASTPKINNYTTSQILKIKNNYFLIDCGEGIQMQLRKLKINFSKISCIFISHLHGDHYFGLIGLISTFRLLGRVSDLNIYAPKGLQELINLHLKLSNSWLNYRIIFHTLTSKSQKIIYEIKSKLGGCGGGGGGGGGTTKRIKTWVDGGGTTKQNENF